MNILLVSDTFLPKMGGTEHIVYTLAKIYIELGHNVMVVCGNSGDLKETVPFKIVKVPALYIKGADDYYSFPRLKKGLKKTIDDFKPDVMHVNTIFVLAKYMLCYAKKHNIRSVLTIHTKFHYSYDIHAPFRKNSLIHKAIVNLLTQNPKKACRLADVVTTVSENSKKTEIIDAYGIRDKEIKVIRNGIDPKKYALAPFDGPKDKITLCFAGRLCKDKNLMFVVDVLKRLDEKGVPFEFHFAGNGKIGNTLKKRVLKYNLDKKVFFDGRLSQNELSSLFSRSDLFMFPSIFDTDGLVVKDAIMCGCYALCIECSGTSENITEGVNGSALPLDIDAFVLKIKELYEAKMKDCDAFVLRRSAIANTHFPLWKESAYKYIEVYEGK